MAINIISWNMQGELDGVSSSSYYHMFSTVLPSLLKKAPTDTWILYLCEAGNPFDLDAEDVYPGASYLEFNSYEQSPDFTSFPVTLPKNFACRGIYCPWQKTSDGKNLRCSVMMMEIVKYDDGNAPQFQLEFNFYASDNATIDNIRPVTFGQFFKDGDVLWSVFGFHNTATESTAIKQLNAAISYIPSKGLGNCFVGDMNIAYPYKKGSSIPSALSIKPYKVMAAGIQTQKSGNQLDWGVQNILDASKTSASTASNLSFISAAFKSGIVSGYNSSDHDILVYTLKG